MKIKHGLMKLISVSFDFLPFSSKKSISKLLGKKQVNFLVAGKRNYVFKLLKSRPDFSVNLILDPKDDYFYLETIGELRNWEEAPLKSWITITEHCKTVIDIGSHFGIYSFVAAKHKNVKHVVAVEPNPYSRNRLISNFRVNAESEKITVLPLALGELESSSNLIAPAGRLTSSGSQLEFSSIDFNLLNYSIISKVNVTTLDNLVQMNKLCDIGAIKIDAEGYELSILMGGKNTLAQYRPSLLIEILSYEQFQSIKQFLKSYNYDSVLPLDGKALSASDNNAIADLNLARNYQFTTIA